MTAQSNSCACGYEASDWNGQTVRQYFHEPGCPFASRDLKWELDVALEALRAEVHYRLLNGGWRHDMPLAESVVAEVGNVLARAVSSLPDGQKDTP